MVCQPLLTRHEELRERARQLLQQARREAISQFGDSPTAPSTGDVTTNSAQVRSFLDQINLFSASSFALILKYLISIFLCRVIQKGSRC